MRYAVTKITYQYYEVDADSPEDAERLVFDGEADELDSDVDVEVKPKEADQEDTK